MHILKGSRTYHGKIFAVILTDAEELEVSTLLYYLLKGDALSEYNLRSVDKPLAGVIIYTTAAVCENSHFQS